MRLLLCVFDYSLFASPTAEKMAKMAKFREKQKVEMFWRQKLDSHRIKGGGKEMPSSHIHFNVGSGGGDSRGGRTVGKEMQPDVSLKSLHL